jgi:tellurite resistance protein
MESRPLNPDARSLEEAFFAKQNAELLEKLRKEARHKERRQALREMVPNADDALLDHLLTIGLGPETVLALVLVPLVAVAWADGRIDPRERAALLKAAEERGVAPGSHSRQLLEGWLGRRPEMQLLEVWKRYVRALRDSLDETERIAIQSRVIDLARGVAEAAGGFLGLGSRISPAERAVLDELEQALR